MKDFCKWLGVNEKVAKIVVWVFIIMCMLIIFNTAFESLGIPYYKLTVENLSKISYPKVFEYVLSWILVLLSFYSVIFIVFPIKDFKQIFKISLIYLVLNVLVTRISNSAIANIFIIIFILGFCFIYSKKNWKYIIYGALSYAFTIGVQFTCYLYKARFLNFDKISYLNKFLTSFDYFIFMLIIILIKEKITKKWGEK